MSRRSQRRLGRRRASGIGARLMPLLDVIFILLLFFMVLPHGIRTSEETRLDYLQERVDAAESELAFLHWRYGAPGSGGVPGEEAAIAAPRLLVIEVHDDRWVVGRIPHYRLEDVRREVTNRILTTRRFEGVLIDKSRDPLHIRVVELERLLHGMGIHSIAYTK